MAATARNELKVEPRGDREIHFYREFDAPRELVWKAMTDRALIEKWWGPRRYRTVVDKLDVRPGGSWRFRNIGADGTEHAFRGEYREVVPPERIVWTFEYEPMAGHISVETMTLEERDGRTIMRAVAVYDGKEDRDAMLASGMEDGARETYERLDELLEELKARV